MWGAEKRQQEERIFREGDIQNLLERWVADNVKRLTAVVGHIN